MRETSAAAAIVIDIDTATVELMPADKALGERRMQAEEPVVWFVVGLKHAHDLANVPWRRYGLPIGMQLPKRLQDLLREIVVEIGQPNRSARHLPASHPLASSPLVSGDSTPHLTPRQIQIVEMIRNGASNKEIACVLGLSLGTIKVHLHRIFKALDVSNRVQLAMYSRVAASKPRQRKGQVRTGTSN